MQGLKFVKKLAVPCGFVAMAVPVVKSQQDSSAPCCHESTNKKLIRPSELPIYSAEHPCSTNTTNKTDSDPPSFLEQNIREIRRAIQKVVKEYEGITDGISNTIDTGIAHSQNTIDYLQEESNIAPRMGAIGIGGLTGFILGLRGGAFRRLLYTTTGALGVSTICYPKAAEESFHMAEHYIKVGYNFIYGVKPGDKQLELPSLELPKLPSSFSDLSELVIDSGLKVGNAIIALPYKAFKAVTEKEENSGVDSKPK